jgi:hypothetical protein
LSWRDEHFTWGQISISFAKDVSFWVLCGVLMALTVHFHAATGVDFGGNRCWAGWLGRRCLDNECLIDCVKDNAMFEVCISIVKDSASKRFRCVKAWVYEMAHVSRLYNS